MSEQLVNWARVLGQCDSVQVMMEWMTDALPEEGSAEVWERCTEILGKLEELEAEIRRAGGIDDDEDEAIEGIHAIGGE